MRGSSMRAMQSGPHAGLDDAAIVRRIHREFGAPVGLVDPVSGGWTAHSGAAAEAFPTDLAPVVKGPHRVGTAEARVYLWNPQELGPVWLVMPLSRGSDRLFALAGFATSQTAPTEGSIRWGPLCPEPALRAWGQQMVDQIHAESLPTIQGKGEMILVARLIRRLKISEPIERFQALATNAVRAAMNVETLAWVPCHHSDPVVVNSELARLEPNDLRTLLPTSPKESPRIENEADQPIDPSLVRSIAVASDTHHPIGWLMAFNPLDGRAFTPADADLLQPVASLIGSQQTNARVYADLKDLLFGVIRALTAAIDAKDPYTSGHSERVARIAVRLAIELGMPAGQRGDLYLMGLMHDVGKIGVDDAVLKKTGPLTPEEYRQIQAHVEIGVLILNDLKKLSHLLPGVRYHHESYDGSGYPTGLAAESIPFEARILAVADSFDAMSSTRPYRRRMTPMQIDEILRRGSGTQWDPKVIDALFACRMDLELIRQKGLGDSLQLAVTETLGRS